MTKVNFLGYITLWLAATCAIAGTQKIAKEPLVRCLPSQPCWPNQKAWDQLQGELSKPLLHPESPLAACQKYMKSEACRKALDLVHNPFYLQSSPGGSESQGWWKAWTYQNSIYAVDARNEQDIVAAVDFARKYNLKLVIKGSGHDYLGRSNAPDSLLIWTHHMQTLEYDKNFVPKGAPKGTPAVAAMKVGAGVGWLQVYQKAAQYDRFVQGGGCTSVGAVGGFTLGGGYGSYSKQYGTGAANLLQATVVTADGKLLTVNKYQHPDLFWALKGGGPGFGVVTEMTYRTYPLPQYFGSVNGYVQAKNDKAYKALIKQVLIFIRDNLMNEHWGEQISFGPDNKIGIHLDTSGLSKKQEEAIFLNSKLAKWLDEQNSAIKGLYLADIDASETDARVRWDAKHHEGDIVINHQEGLAKGLFWWAGNSNEAFNYWSSYRSWWLPLILFAEKDLAKLTDVFYQASRLHDFSLHLNKGLAGSSKTALVLQADTAVNPAVEEAAGLIVITSGNNSPASTLFGLSDSMKKDMQVESKQTKDAIMLFKKLAPNAGTYINETDYFEPKWQKAFWGDNYQKLLKIKLQYDPDGLFYCHHCVGSEYWDKAGMKSIAS
ncbi:FAD-dependent oxidoreductase [Cysteiniphilum litorale]|uniref:FAD-dependent oxidoreductase n=1 Tax=Cysteiniphilum litorale TaxID=2056700 RepID=UPI003F88505D